MDVNDRIKFTCPNCHKKLSAELRHANKKTRCPKCQTVFNIPASTATPTAQRHSTAQACEQITPAANATNIKAELKEDTKSCLIALVIGLIWLALIITTICYHNLFLSCLLIIGGGIAGATYSSHLRKKDREARIENIRRMEKEMASLNNFTASQTITSYDGSAGLAIDETRKQICLSNKAQGNIACRVCSHKDLISCELFENGASITKTERSGQVGGAVIGGLAFGAAGAVIGGLSANQTTSAMVSRVELRLIINDPQNPIHDIILLKLLKAVPKSDPSYENAYLTARQFHAWLQILIRQADADDKNSEAAT